MGKLRVWIDVEYAAGEDGAPFSLLDEMGFGFPIGGAIDEEYLGLLKIMMRKVFEVGSRYGGDDAEDAVTELMEVVEEAMSFYLRD